MFYKKVSCCRLPLYTVAGFLKLVRRGWGLQRMSKAPSSPSHKGRNERKTRNAEDPNKDNEVSWCLCMNYRLKCEQAALCSTISSYCSRAYEALIDSGRLTSRLSGPPVIKTNTYTHYITLIRCSFIKATLSKSCWESMTETIRNK